MILVVVDRVENIAVGYMILVVVNRVENIAVGYMIRWKVVFSWEQLGTMGMVIYCCTVVLMVETGNMAYRS
jgi:hypothetical protein